VDLAGAAGELTDVHSLKFSRMRRQVRVGIWFSAIQMSSTAERVPESILPCGG
jgi:hypothetical protein